MLIIVIAPVDSADVFTAEKIIQATDWLLGKCWMSSFTLMLTLNVAVADGWYSSLWTEVEIVSTKKTIKNPTARIWDC